MRPQITIELDEYTSLLQDSAAWNAVKRDKPFIHIHTYYTLGGKRIEFTSNDERVERIAAIIKEKDDLMSKDFHTIQDLKQQIEKIKSRGFFKRLFS